MLHFFIVAQLPFLVLEVISTLKVTLPNNLSLGELLRGFRCALEPRSFLASVAEQYQWEYDCLVTVAQRDRTFLTSSGLHFCSLSYFGLVLPIDSYRIH